MYCISLELSETLGTFKMDRGKSKKQFQNLSPDCLKIGQGNNYNNARFLFQFPKIHTTMVENQDINPYSLWETG